MTTALTENSGNYQILNFGPAQPIMHGALRLKLKLDGETIVAARMEIGYLHRCFEKMSELQTWSGVIPYTDRLNYCSSLTNNLGYCIAVEDWMGIKVPPRGQALRVFLNEMHRIMDHCTCLGPGLVDLGALTNMWYTFTAREFGYNVIETLCGSRLLTSYLRIGGLTRDVPSNFVPKAREFLATAPRYLDDVRRLVEKNRIFIERTKNIGVVSYEDAMAWGFTGPCARASGVNYDVRKVRPYSGYENYDFEIPLGTRGDVYDRYLVRLEEVRQSFRIMQQVLDNLPDGPVIADDPRAVLPPKRETYRNIEGLMNHFKLIFDGIQVPAGEWYSFTEAANGELGFFIVSDGGGKPYRIKVRPPCFAICQAIEKMVVGHMVPDLTAIIGSLNIVAGELDR
jgi:NADH-quinone oxidoreductase subunit C/D